MKTEQTVDVFQAIKIIRGTRPQFVENVVSTYSSSIVIDDLMQETDSPRKYNFNCLF